MLNFKNKTSKITSVFNRMLTSLRMILRESSVLQSCCCCCCCFFLNSSVFRRVFQCNYPHGFNPFNRQPHKMSKHDQTIRWLLPNKFFDCVWPFFRVDAWRDSSQDIAFASKVETSKHWSYLLWHILEGI